MSPTVAKSSITATGYSRFSAEINNPAPTASTATPAATLPGFSLVKVLALSVELFKYSRAVLRYSSMSTFCICVRRLLIISSLMPSLPRNCSRPLLPPKAWPHCGQTPLPGDFIGVVSLEVMPVGPAPVLGVSMVVVLLSVAPGAVLARLVRASVRADTRVAGLVREAVLVVPAILGDDVVLVALAIGAARAERALQARLRRRIRVADDVERHVGLQASRPGTPLIGSRRRASRRRLHRYLDFFTAKQLPRRARYGSAHARDSRALPCLPCHASPFPLTLSLQE